MPFSCSLPEDSMPGTISGRVNESVHATIRRQFSGISENAVIGAYRTEQIKVAILIRMIIKTETPSRNTIINPNIRRKNATTPNKPMAYKNDWESNIFLFADKFQDDAPPEAALSFKYVMDSSIRLTNQRLTVPSKRSPLARSSDSIWKPVLRDTIGVFSIFAATNKLHRRE